MPYMDPMGLVWYSQPRLKGLFQVILFGTKLLKAGALYHEVLLMVQKSGAHLLKEVGSWNPVASQVVVWDFWTINSMKHVSFFWHTAAKFDSSPLKRDGWKTILSFRGPVTFKWQAAKLQGCNFGTPRISGETCKRSRKQLPGKQVAVNFHPLYP